MYYRYLLSILITGLAISQIRAQVPVYTQVLNVPVYNGNALERFPWVGGLSAPQFCNPDLNNDGIKDLVIFDRTGTHFYTFINKGAAGRMDYVYAPEYEANMVPSDGWVKFNEIDGTTYFFNDTTSTVRAYKGYYDANNRLAFKKYIPYMFEIIPNSSCSYCNLYSASNEMPAFEDIDGDGDMDILNFDVLGFELLLHQNMAKEWLNRTDTFVFEQTDQCWGNMEQKYWYQRGFILHDSCPRVNSPVYVPTRHSGNTVCLWDVKHNGLKDLFYGNIIFNNIDYVNNAGTDTFANCNWQDTLWQTPGKTASVNTYPSAYHIDINNDGREDIIIAPNAPLNNESFHNVWLYQNLNIGVADSFKFQQDTFLIKDMIETGTGCNPAVVDINNDGLPDLVLGNNGYYDTTSGALLSTLTVYLNTGTATHPQFKLATRNYLNLLAFSKTGNFNNFAPAFGDLNNDGKPDMIIGNSNGELTEYINTTTGSGMATFSIAASPMRDNTNRLINVTGNATPLIYDYNGDGKPDLIIGCQAGTLAYYKNTGTKTNPVFTKVTDSLGHITTANLYYPDGYSYPAITTVQGKTYMLVGQAAGYVQRYLLDTTTNSKYTLIDSLVTKLSTGTNTSVCSATIISGSAAPQIFIGNLRGGLQLFSTDTVNYNLTDTLKFTATSNISPANNNLSVRTTPNPAHDNCNINISPIESMVQLYIYDTYGNVMYENNNASNQNQINMQQWPAGLYIVRVCSGQTCITRKVIKY